MGKVESVIKSEIVRLARREVRQIANPLKKEVWALKNTLAQLRKAVSQLERFASLQRRQWEEKPPLKAAPEEVATARFHPKLIRSLRRRLGLSQRDFARLAGVTPLAVYQWETGVFKPSKQKKEVLVALRKLGRREAKKLLEEMKTLEKKKTPPPEKKAETKSPKK
ncbi:MAG: helix-turn-helix domain-containing protein [Desulfobacterota bacterium]|nr:helix-turn-helix domain-containing protein [Thermodesulfobacteriota bacterium]